MWYKQRVRGKVQDILRDSCRYSEKVGQRVDDTFREKENEKEKNGKRENGISDTVSYSKGTRQKMRCYEDTEFLLR